MKEQKLKLKSELKVLALEIKDLKSKRKNKEFTNGHGYVYGLESAQSRFRIKHIAYCILRGRTLEEIEPKLRDPQSSTNLYVRREAKKLVDAIMVEVTNAQVVCNHPQ